MAATSVLKLVVDDKEYSASLKNAKQGMQDLQQSLEKAGKSFADVDKSIVDYAKGLGQMETVSKTARGQIGEMSSAFVELSKVYNQMTEQEKQSPVGKALSESLGQLRQRTIDAKDEMANLNRQLEPVNSTSRETGGIMGTLKDKLTLNVDALKLFNAGLQAAKAALDVAKDAFMASEANVDEWGRIIDSSKSLYEGFLNALNTGDITGYLGRIDQIVQAARAAYNELDRLGTMKTIQAPQMSAQQTENERMRMMIQTGRYIAPVDGRRASMQNGQLLTPEQIRRIEQQLQNGMKNIVSLIGNEVKQTGKAIDAVYNRQAQELGISLKEFRKGTSSMAEFDKRVEGARKYQEWQAQHSFIDQQTGREIAPRTGNPYAQYKGWDVFRVDGQRYNDLVRLIQQRDQQAVQAYNMQSQAYRTMNRAEGITVSKIMNGGSGNGGGSGSKTTTDTFAEGSIAEQEKLVADLTKKWKNAGEAVRDDYKKELESAKAVLDNMVGNGFDTSRVAPIMDKTGSTPMAELADIEGPTIPVKIEIDASPLTLLENQLKSLTEAQLEFGRYAPEVWQSYEKSIEEVKQKIAEFKGSNTLEKDADASKKAFQSAASAIGQVGNALNSIEDPAAKVIGIVAQAIATVANAHAQALNQDNSTKSNIWAFLAAAVASTASMVSMISSIHSATGYAEGGVIPGNHFSGDMQWARVNAGEVILNHAQVGQLASELENSGVQNLRLSTSISGEQIRIVLNNNGNRTGRGEYVTSKIR